MGDNTSASKLIITDSDFYESNLFLNCKVECCRVEVFNSEKRDSCGALVSDCLAIVSTDCGISDQVRYCSEAISQADSITSGPGGISFNVGAQA